jgi:GT2 family glycosyltransferase
VKAVALVPIFDHGATVAAVVDGLAPLALPALIVDDGSGAETQRALARVTGRHPWVQVVRHPRNRGRGAALATGYRAAARAGFTHALQLDADAQHDPADAKHFLAAAARMPEALVLGAPIFDADAPRARRWGRLVSRAWVWIETCSFAIADPLCGYRCMPLAATLAVLDRTRCGERMDFDPEIAVRLVWAGVPVVNVPTRVRYHAGGISHFDMFADNVRISWLHTRLVAGMLPRLPALLRRRP